ncbi:MULTISPECIES: DUF2306 domain-containing protein [Auritidibacter]|uniref:DUF2306 domain-containing protein n=1 Tax=Auritidibacter TaxID=1160973 RepID=UPI000F3B5CA5|nr:MULTISPECIES: DUF2306 domain-containing protein [Auritidibacter]NIH72077.1 putative membrane protein [Auritidibacter ignavus]RMX23910.1 hypothetical protein DYI20_01900 [Auritidibacter ignavus]WGH80733.1 hypothetical protein QDX25_07955 [Auritidibacter ignavus]WGH85933.1 hypothetical protein QDX24_10230 [Auritidibacter ignavus]WGH88220.1 hypothetical protein QDX22_10235 [Auritidibacter ignavus]
METIPLAVIVHASAAFLVLIIGPVNIFRPRRDAVHRVLGRTWVGLMYLTCGSSFFFGLEDGFTFLHGLSVFTTVTVTLGVWMIVSGSRRGHIGNMVGSYIGTLIAFGFAAFVPTRLIWTTAVTSPVALAAFAGALALIAGAWFAVLKARLGSGGGKGSRKGIAEGPRQPVG